MPKTKRTNRPTVKPITKPARPITVGANFPLPKSRFVPHDRIADGMPSCLSENIRTRRLARKLTYPAFADETGLSAPMLKQVEMGRRAPSLDALISIARALETTPSKLLEGVE